MIILDTDVLSETFKARPEPRLIKWLNAQRFVDICITSITLMEVVMGIEEMPRGNKRQNLEIALLDALRTFLKGRVLPFDEQSAWQAGRLYGRRRGGGIAVGTPDTQIAGIALCHRATLATGNVRHFSDLDIPVINPWDG